MSTRRIREAHRRFLLSCRALSSQQAYWSGAGRLRRWILELASGGSLLELSPEGERIQKALDWIEGNRSERRLDQAVLKRLHGLLFDGGGRYRTARIAVAGSRVARPAAKDVTRHMDEWEREAAEAMAALRGNPDPDAALGLAAATHQRIAFIHPFDDGNGRVARLAMNLVLRSCDLGYVILPPISESKRHFDVLDEAHAGNLEPFVAFCRENWLPA